MNLCGPVNLTAVFCGLQHYLHAISGRNSPISHGRLFLNHHDHKPIGIHAVISAVVLVL